MDAKKVWYSNRERVDIGDIPMGLWGTPIGQDKVSIYFDMVEGKKDNQSWRVNWYLIKVSSS